MVQPIITKAQGFTLIELMITVVVIAILAMVAIPAYNDSVTKGRRTDAKSTLTDIAAKQEQFFMDNKTYTTDLTKLGYAAASDAFSKDDYYKVTVTAASATAFSVKAVPVKDDPKCGTYTINEQGTQAVTGTLGADLCW